MFGKYALPSDDKAGTATVTASVPVAGYAASNLVAPTNTGHLNLPSRPAKLGATTGYFDLSFPSPIMALAAALICHNLDGGLSGVTLDVNSNSYPFTIPAKPNALDDWTLSPWIEFGPETSAAWRLNFASANSLNIQVGRLLLIGTLRQLETDVRYGGTDDEGRLVIADPTELGIDTMYDLFNVRRSFSEDFLFRPSETTALRALHRDSRNRVLPWLLIPDEDENDAMLVRFEDDAYQRTNQTIGANAHPFRVREVSRGLPWP